MEIHPSIIFLKFIYVIKSANEQLIDDEDDDGIEI